MLGSVVGVMMAAAAQTVQAKTARRAIDDAILASYPPEPGEYTTDSWEGALSSYADGPEWDSHHTGFRLGQYSVSP